MKENKCHYILFCRYARGTIFNPLPVCQYYKFIIKTVVLTSCLHYLRKRKSLTLQGSSGPQSVSLDDFRILEFTIKCVKFNQKVRIYTNLNSARSYIKITKFKLGSVRKRNGHVILHISSQDTEWRYTFFSKVLNCPVLTYSDSMFDLWRTLPSLHLVLFSWSITSVLTPLNTPFFSTNYFRPLPTLPTTSMRSMPSGELIMC